MPSPSTKTIAELRAVVARHEVDLDASFAQAINKALDVIERADKVGRKPDAIS